MNDGTNGVTWRAATRAGSATYRAIPAWLIAAKSFKGSLTAKHIVDLAGKVFEGLKITVLLGREKIVETGLVLKLGVTSKESAYRALIAIAETGGVVIPETNVRKGITVNLEDAVSVQKAGRPVSAEQLSEIFGVRNMCGELNLAGVRIKSGEVKVADLPGTKIVEIMEALEGTHPGSSTLAKVLIDFATVGWDIYFEKRAGDYQLSQVIEAVI